MLPVQYLARVLDVPARDVPDRPIAGLVGVQPAQNAIQRDQAGPRAALETFIVGQLVSGQVKSLNKGIALVEIDGQIVAMRLPKDVAVGDTLRLRFSGHLPHPVFQLELADLAAAESPNLSSTARMLSDLMQQVPARTMPMLTPAEALLKQPTAAPAELALALRSALVRSGLFYESHLANWVVGQDSLDNLLQEPQNRLAAEAARNAPQSAAQLLLGADGAERMPMRCCHSNCRFWSHPSLPGAVSSGRARQWNGKSARKPNTLLVTPRRQKAGTIKRVGNRIFDSACLNWAMWMCISNSMPNTLSTSGWCPSKRTRCRYCSHISRIWLKNSRQQAANCML